MLAQPYLNQSTGFALLRHLKIQDPVQSSKICDVWISPRKIMLRRTLANMTMFLAIDLCQYHAVVARQNPCETEYSLHLIACKRELNIEIGRFDSLDVLAAQWQDWGHFTHLPMLVETESGALRALPSIIRPDRRKGLASALKYRRRRYAHFRAKTDLSLSQISFKGSREIIGYE